MESNKAPRPWVRANLEQFCPETLELIPQSQQQEYISLMKELHHSKSIVALAIERMYMFEQARAAFFEPFITNSPDSSPGADTSDYTPVTDLNEYRERRG